MSRRAVLISVAAVITALLSAVPASAHHWYKFSGYYETYRDCLYAQSNFARYNTITQPCTYSYDWYGWYFNYTHK
jgi:hypothetical protein